MHNSGTLSSYMGRTTIPTLGGKISALILLTTTLLTAEAAQETARPLADDSFADMPVVLSSNTLDQNPSTSPLTISSISRQMIAATGARTIPDALRLVPGMVVGHSVNEFGDKPRLVVAYHGHTDQFSKQMNVLIDGRSIYDPLLGGVNWYNIPIAIDDIERIEVTHGPNASTYGSNSFQAVINIITRHASEDQGHFVKINAGNHDIFDTTYRYGGHNNDLDYRFTIATVNDNGQDRKDETDAFDDVNAGQFDYRLDYQADSKNKFTYQGGYGRTDQDTEGTLRNELLISPRRVIEDTSAHQLLRWDSTINTQQSFVVKYFYNYFKEDDAFKSMPIDLSLINPSYAGVDPLSVTIDQSHKTQRHNIDFTHFINTTKDVQIIWGASVQDDIIHSDYHLHPENKQNRFTYRLFANAVWDVDKHHSFDIGLLSEKSDGSETDLSPRFSYLHRINNNHALRAGISQAVRTPFIFEQFGSVFITEELTIGGTPTGLFASDYFFVPKNQLKTEKITSTEIAYRGRFLNNDLSINARLFQDKLKDLTDAPSETISETPDIDGQAFVFNNAQATTVQGFELQFDIKLSHKTRFFANGSLLKISSDDNPETGRSINYEESAPDKSVSLLMIHDFNQSDTFSLSYYHVSDFSFLDVNNVNPQNNRNTGGYNKMDVRFAHVEKHGDEQISTALVVQNMLDDYSDYDAVPNTAESVVTQNLTAFIEIKLKFR